MVCIPSLRIQSWLLRRYRAATRYSTRQSSAPGTKTKKRAGDLQGNQPAGNQLHSINWMQRDTYKNFRLFRTLNCGQLRHVPWCLPSSTYSTRLPNLSNEGTQRSPLQAVSAGIFSQKSFLQSVTCLGRNLQKFENMIWTWCRNLPKRKFGLLVTISFVLIFK